MHTKHKRNYKDNMYRLTTSTSIYNGPEEAKQQQQQQKQQKWQTHTRTLYKEIKLQQVDIHTNAREEKQTKQNKRNEKKVESLYLM